MSRRELLDTAETLEQKGLTEFRSGDEDVAADYLESAARCQRVLASREERTELAAKRRQHGGTLAQTAAAIRDGDVTRSDLNEALTSTGDATDAGSQSPQDDTDASSAEPDARHVSAEDSDVDPEFAERFITDADTSWDEIAGLDSVQKSVLTTLGIKAYGEKPEAADDEQNILLFGPPGTGKTLLAEAVANTDGAVFYNVESDAIRNSKYGSSESRLKAVFESAKQQRSAVVFFDEIDNLGTQRSGDDHTADRQILSTLLQQTDGMDTGESGTPPLIIATTNTPWDLDAALRRRFSSRVYVPLPDKVAATEIVEINTAGVGVPISDQFDADRFVPHDETIGFGFHKPAAAIGGICAELNYSGSDVAALCNEAFNHMVQAHNPNLVDRVLRDYDSLRDETLPTRPLRPEDFDAAWDRTSSSIDNSELQRYEQWKTQFGSSF
jgi:SpoVK/Ycf46/Vps4 family AAA+-type ATPase